LEILSKPVSTNPASLNKPIKNKQNNIPRILASPLDGDEQSATLPSCFNLEERDSNTHYQARDASGSTGPNEEGENLCPLLVIET
jgi:hypothetical protein